MPNIPRQDIFGEILATILARHERGATNERCLLKW